MRFFISYAHKDAIRVEEINEILQDAGYDVWYDHELIGGEEWQIQLEENIKIANAVIYIMSPDSVASKYCEQELEQARRFKKPIIPILIKDVSIPPHTTHIQYVDFRGEVSTATATSKLTRAIRNIESKRNWRQLFIPIALLLTAIGFVAILYNTQLTSTLRPMNGDFNIAVAQFDEVPSTSNPTLAPIISRQIFDALDSEYVGENFGFNIQVTHPDKTLKSWEDAKTLAQNVNADIVIYGNVRVVPGSDQFIIDPGFYVSDTFPHDLEELAGQHGLELPITITPDELANPTSEANSRLQAHIATLVEFTQGMAYLSSNNKLELADQSFRRAVSLVAPDDTFKGKELIYLFASSTSRLLHKFQNARQYITEALKINPNYGRAFIAAGNIFYDQGKNQYNTGDYETAQENLATALTYYQKASVLEDQPYGTFIQEKANSNIGAIYTIQYLIPDTLDKETSAKQAISYFSDVIASYQRNSQPGLSEIAANAYYWSGVIYQSEGDLSKAKEVFNQVLATTQNPDFIKDAETRLEQIG
jgi:tetratricopeptide (TPR) repeat protein